MDCAKTGGLIRRLRQECGLTQRELADSMNISDKAVSKWERGLGCPDVTLLAPLSEILGVSVESLLKGVLTAADVNGGNMKKIRFFRCAECGNVLTAVGACEVTCCGRSLPPMRASDIPDSLELRVEPVEDEWYITMNHPMTKKNYVAFAAYVSIERMLLVRLYPEQECAVRIPVMHGGELYICSTEHGLMKKKL